MIVTRGPTAPLQNSISPAALGLMTVYSAAVLGTGAAVLIRRDA